MKRSKNKIYLSQQPLGLLTIPRLLTRFKILLSNQVISRIKLAQEACVNRTKTNLSWMTPWIKWLRQPMNSYRENSNNRSPTRRSRQISLLYVRSSKISTSISTKLWMNKTPLLKTTTRGTKSTLKICTKSLLIRKFLLQKWKTTYISKLWKI